MGSKKDIGKFYKQELEGYTSTPSKSVWGNIELELKKKKRRLAVIWSIAIGIGLSILVFSLITLYTSYAHTYSDSLINETEQIDQNTSSKKTNASNSDHSSIDIDNDNTSTYLTTSNDSTNLKTQTTLRNTKSYSKSSSTKKGTTSLQENNDQTASKKSSTKIAQSTHENHLPNTTYLSNRQRKDSSIKNTHDSISSANLLNPTTTSRLNLTAVKTKEKEDQDKKD